MATVPSKDARTSTRIAWAVAVIGVVALALFLRSYWNLDPALEEGDEFRLSGGSDPYYHKHAIDRIQENGFKTTIWDPMLNYPYGSVNPNPPLFQWSVATTGLVLQPFFGGDLEVATWWAMLTLPALFGALTVIPIYVVGSELFGRRAGLLAGVFWALSTASIDQTSLGASDHDALYMLFLVTGFAFYVKFIHAIRGDPNWVARWNDSASVKAGLAAFFRERKVALAYAVLAGISLGAVALIWKGFPYATGIIFIYAGLQLVVDTWRNRDSTGLFLGSVLATGLPILVALPYYAATDLMNFLLPASYLVLGLVVAGLVLVPTRDYPAILVLPAAAVVGAIGIALTFLVPQLAFVRLQLLYATVYFRQSAIYQTIAEAHPAAFDDIVFGVGPLVFFVGLLGLAWLLLTARKHPRRDTLFTFVWGVIAIYMAQSAVRFLFNAVPVFAILGGWLTARAIAWFDFGAYARSAEASGLWRGLRRAFSGWHVVGVLAIVLLLVMPSVLLAVDAAVPFEVERGIVEESGEDSVVGRFVNNRLGAFSQGFLPVYWKDGLGWLDEHNADIPPEERPAFLSWWDYGHWAIAIGRHPASADNFQNGYVHAGNFIASQNETHAVQLLAARQVERDAIDPAEAKEHLRTVGVTDVDATYDALKTFQYAPELDLDRAVRFLSLVEETTGYRIRYFAVDSRMLPYDSPQTPYIDLQGILYAPVLLAEKDIDDYVEPRFQGNDGGDYSREQAERLVRDSSLGFGVQNFQIVGESYVYKRPFFDSMFWRTFSGAPPRGEGPTWRGDALEEGLDAPAPAFAMRHFRLVYMNENLRILQYYPGAKVSGVVTQDGAPVPNAVVSVLDDAGGIVLPHVGPGTAAQIRDESDLDIPHDRGVTDADGRFSVLSPFSLTERGVTFVATLQGVEIGRETLVVTREQAETGAVLDVLRFDVAPAHVRGTAFVDADRDGVFDAETERRAANTTVTIGGRNATTDADGRFEIRNVPPGTRTVSVASDLYEVREQNRTVRVNPGDSLDVSLPLVLRPVPVTGTVGADLDGDGAIGPGETIGNFPVEFLADEAIGANPAVDGGAVTAEDGVYADRLVPGAYVVRASYTTEDGTVYSIEDRFTIPEGATTFERDFVLVRGAPPAEPEPEEEPDAEPEA